METAIHELEEAARATEEAKKLLTSGIITLDEYKGKVREIRAMLGLPAEPATKTD